LAKHLNVENREVLVERLKLLAGRSNADARTKLVLAMTLGVAVDEIDDSSPSAGL